MTHAQVEYNLSATSPPITPNAFQFQKRVELYVTEAQEGEKVDLMYFRI